MADDPSGAPGSSHPGLRNLFSYPLMAAITERRTRRVARGTSISSGPISHTSTNAPAPLSPLEEAVLVVSTGLTGRVTMHDVPANNAGREPALFRAAHQRPRPLRQQHRQRARRVVLPDQRRGHVADQAPRATSRRSTRWPSCRSGGRTGRRRTGSRRPTASSTGCTRSAWIFHATGRTTSSGTGRCRTARARRFSCPSST